MREGGGGRRKDRGEQRREVREGGEGYMLRADGFSVAQLGSNKCFLFGKFLQSCTSYQNLQQASSKPRTSLISLLIKSQHVGLVWCVKLKMFIFIPTRTIPLPQDHKSAHARTCGHKTRCTANTNK